MSGRPAARRSAVLSLALGGVVLGHAITYGLLVPDTHARAGALAATGHGYLAALERVGLTAVLIALAATFLGRLARRDGSDAPGLGAILGRVTAFQLTAFAALEVAERLGAGASLQDLPAVLSVGLVAQAIIALVAALVLRSVLRLATAAALVLGAARSPLSRPVLALTLPAAPQGLHPAHRLLPESRGPPRRC